MDDIALATQQKDLSYTETTLTADLNILNGFFQTWKLKPDPTKTKSSLLSYEHIIKPIICYSLNKFISHVRKANTTAK